MWEQHIAHGALCPATADQGSLGHPVESIAAAVTGTVPAGTEGCRQQGSGRPAGGDVGRSKPASSKPAATATEAGGSPGSQRLAGTNWAEQRYPMTWGPNLEGRWGQGRRGRSWELVESDSNVNQWGERQE